MESEQKSAISFEQVLNATVTMLRSTWKAQHCLFLLINDQGELRVRASDDSVASQTTALVLKTTVGGPLASCIKDNKMIEMTSMEELDGLQSILGKTLGVGQRYLLVPVTGDARVLGMLILGPFHQDQAMNTKESELRSAGALCAVLSAHWRLYEWMSQFIPQVNHELRTPLTAIQGSIDMVLGGMFGQVGSEVKQMLEMAHKGCERTVRAIEGYLNHQQPK